MEEASSLPVSDPANPWKRRRRKQLTILIACVLIATALWFLRALENEYTTRVDHPVQYINLPDKMMTLDPLPQRISLEVKGLGFSVLRHNWNFSKTPLIIDVNKLKFFPSRKKKGFVEYMPMNQFLNDFSSQLKDLKVLATLPDTLMLRFAVKKTRTVRVIPAFIYDSNASIIPDSLVRVNPDSIIIEGPDLIVDTIHSIRTQPVKINRKGEAFSRSLGLQEINRLIIIKPAKVTVTVSQKIPI